jgi:hypothetical protein
MAGSTRSDPSGRARNAPRIGLEVGRMAEKQSKKIDPKAPEADAQKDEKNAARVEKKESLRRKVSRRKALHK